MRLFKVNQNILIVFTFGVTRRSPNRVRGVGECQGKPNAALGRTGVGERRGQSCSIRFAKIGAAASRIIPKVRGAGNTLRRVRHRAGRAR
jgi:hypothetical protein